MTEITGIHHVTAIAGDAQENLDFYAGILGMRLVKKSVNQDDPSTYHLFYADAEGHPGADLTFFPMMSSAPARIGTGLGVETALAVPAGSLSYWAERLQHYGVKLGDPDTRRGAPALPVIDPHGLALALVETTDARTFTPWSGSPVPEAQQIRGLHAVRLWEQDLSLTANFLKDVLGFVPMGQENGWHTFGVGAGGSGQYLEVRELPTTRRGRWSTGSMHHVAWRVADNDDQLKVRERVNTASRRPTQVIDRFWFRSVYFLEPGGVLFEVATDGPGFTVDEDLANLGTQLVLPPWLEERRAEIEAGLPKLRTPEAGVISQY